MLDIMKPSGDDLGVAYGGGSASQKINRNIAADAALVGCL